MEEEVRVGFNIQVIKNFNGVVVGVVVKKILLVIFEYGFKQDMISKKLTILTVDSRPDTEED